MEEIESLKKLTLKKLKTTSSDLDLLMTLHKRYSIYMVKFEENEIDTDLISHILVAINFRMFLGFLRADICSALNAYNNSETIYESKFATRNFIVIINEGIKKIYHFVYKNENGNEILSQRNKSFWIKDIKPLIESKYLSLKDEYNSLTVKLDNYVNLDFKKIKEYRDLSIHYDKDSTELYWMIVNLNYTEIEEITLDFFSITNRLINFSEKVTEKLSTEIAEYLNY